MIIIRDLWNVDTLKRKMQQGDILEIYNTKYDCSKIYFDYKGILMACYDDMSDGDYCSDGEFYGDLRMALLDPARYFIKLVTDTEVEVVIAEEGAEI